MTKINKIQISKFNTSSWQYTVNFVNNKTYNTDQLNVSLWLFCTLPLVIEYPKLQKNI